MIKTLAVQTHTTYKQIKYIRRLLSSVYYITIMGNHCNRTGWIALGHYQLLRFFRRKLRVVTALWWQDITGGWTRNYRLWIMTKMISTKKLQNKCVMYDAIIISNSYKIRSYNLFIISSFLKITKSPKFKSFL